MTAAIQKIITDKVSLECTNNQINTLILAISGSTVTDMCVDLKSSLKLNSVDRIEIKTPILATKSKEDKLLISSDHYIIDEIKELVKENTLILTIIDKSNSLAKDIIIRTFFDIKVKKMLNSSGTIHMGIGLIDSQAQTVSFLFETL